MTFANLSPFEMVIALRSVKKELRLSNSDQAAIYVASSFINLNSSWFGEKYLSPRTCHSIADCIEQQIVQLVSEKLK